MSKNGRDTGLFRKFGGKSDNNINNIKNQNNNNNRLNGENLNVNSIQRTSSNTIRIVPNNKIDIENDD